MILIFGVQFYRFVVSFYSLVVPVIRDRDGN